MDWASLIIAGLSGGIAGAVGGLLSGLFGGRAQSIIVTVFVVAGVVALPRFISPYIEPHLGPLLRDATGQTAVLDEELDKLMAEPLFEAITDGDPEKEEEIKQRLRDAYRTGGEKALMAEAQKIGEEFSGTMVFAKMPYARDEDIVAFFQTSVNILRRLEFDNADMCYQWSYGAQFGDPVDPDAFNRAIGDSLNKDLIDTMVAIVKNASSTLVAYDQFGAQLSIQLTANAVLGRLQQGPLEVITGLRPAQSADEKRIVCRATGDMYAYILGLDNGADTFRELFRPQPNIISQLGIGGLSAARHVLLAGDPENVFGDNTETFMNAFR